MDPPASPSSSHAKGKQLKQQSKLQHEKAQQQQQQQQKQQGLTKPNTPKTTNTAQSSSTHPSHFPKLGNKSSFGKNNPYNATKPLHRSRNAAKIIKGEIHNVLTVMRSDPRYYSTGGGVGDNNKRIQSRFEYEERQNNQSPSLGRGRFWKGIHHHSTNNNNGDWKNNNNNNNRGTTISSHPVLQGLRDLHDLLSVVEVEGNSISGGGGNVVGAGGKGGTKSQKLSAPTFVTPFAAAVMSKDVDARTTGEALSALHKFIAYGFIGGHDADDDDPMEESSSAENVRESISAVAQCIRRCSFEGDDGGNNNNCNSNSKSSLGSRGRGMFSFWSSGEKQRPNSIPGDGGGTTAATAKAVDGSNKSNGYHELPSFLTQPRRSTSKSKGNATANYANSNSTNNLRSSSSSSSYAFPSPSDEDVVLKLLSLSVQVTRCPAGLRFLPPSEVVGIFDTCLHVAIAASDGTRGTGGGETQQQQQHYQRHRQQQHRRHHRHLLRSAAGDALSHCVIVAFGMRRGVATTKKKKRARGRIAERDGKDDGDTKPTHDYDDDVTDDSDDDWGERDPTEDFLKDGVLVRNRTREKAEREKETPRGEDGSEDAVRSSTVEEEEGGEEEPALVAIMHRLATLADPLLHEDDTCVLALSLVNIALETMSDEDIDDALSTRYPRLLTIMQNDLCRNLLRLSTSPDLTILGLALRVIFNLFNSIKDHLKVQLEVFLTSVHLRTLSFSTPPNSANSNERVWSSSPERRELALESLLEFCREPMLMADLYLNYDCDINCTNLFETICVTLARVANPENESVDRSGNGGDGESDGQQSSDDDDDDDDDAAVTQYQKPRLNILNRLALEGVLAVIDAIARRCRASSKYEGVTSLPDDDRALSLDPMEDNSSIAPSLSPPDSGNSDFLGNTLYISNSNDNNNNLPTTAGGSSGSVVSSEYDFCNISTTSSSAAVAAAAAAGKFNDRRTAGIQRFDSEMSESDMEEWLSKARYHTSLALRERKLRKRRMAKAAVEFNERSRDREWIEEAERVGVLPTPATPKSVASFLYSTPKLDKAKIGLYISKGPKEKYPFHAEVLESFASLFDFTGMSFSEALRTFLGGFRLPGEAQCIDRLMEAFATRLYEVQLSTGSSVAVGSNTTTRDQSVEKTMLDPPRRGNSDGEFGSGRSGTLDPPAASDEVDLVFPFKSSDAAFILSFSTIMLNTDLHNPNMKDEKRMTQDQFIRNNRGINDGADLPIEFLTNLYYEIKNDEIQVNQDLLQDGGADAFDGLLAKANDVATPFFTQSSHHKFLQAGVHERDMFVSICSAAINAISAVFVESWDDVLVTKALDGMQNSAYICSYFGLDQQFNQILELLLGFGLDYAGSVTTLMYTTKPVDVEAGVETSGAQSNGIRNDNGQAMSNLEAELMARDIPPLPESFLSTLTTDVGSQSVHMDISDMTGSAAHRGLLSLNCALTLTKQHLSFVREAWPMLLDVIFALRDVNALPRLSDLDDFADSRGNPLPRSVFANRSHQRVNEYMESIAPSEKSSNAGFFSSFFGFGQSPSSQEKEVDDGSTEKLFPLSETLQQVAQCAQLDKIIMKTNDVAMAKRILFAMLGSMFPDEDDEDITSDPLFEHNSVFVLELAARLLISNRAHAAELYPIFLTKFQQLISPQIVETNGASKSIVLGLKFPYILERIVVTILRACIHLFDVPEVCLRDQLNRSLNLIATLPSSYTKAINERIGCGAAIILRGCFYLFDDSSDDWSTIKGLLDLAAQDKSGRGFVFDGIASVIDSIDYAIPSAGDGDMQNCDENKNDVQLSKCGVEVMASLLLKFMDGSYEDDVSFKVPSMTYINKVYSFSQHFSDRALVGNGSANANAHLQENEFVTMVTAIYNDACLATDGATVKKGFESLQGLVLSTKVESIPVANWFTFLDLVATNPPGITSQEARVYSLSLIGRLFLTLMPELSNQKDNWSQLEDWTISVASIVSDNLQAGRATPLFETTVQTVTNIVNVMSMSGFNEGEGVNFCAWVGETLLFELEKVGACGGATSMIAATRGNNNSK